MAREKRQHEQQQLFAQIEGSDGENFSSSIALRSDCAAFFKTSSKAFCLGNGMYNGLI